MYAQKTDISTKNELLCLVQRFCDVSVLVIGDIMLDRFVYGGVERISPESPVPVLNIKRENYMLGGAGNALANLSGLGVEGHIITLIGDDGPGEQVRTLLADLGADDRGLIQDEARATTIKTRFLAGHQQLLRTDTESKDPISDAVKADILDRAEQIIPSVHAVIISDYDKGLLRRDLLQDLIKLARAHNCPVIVDPKGTDFSKYRGASMITPNKKELSAALPGMPVDGDENIVSTAQALIEKSGVETVMVTRSSEGLSIIGGQNAPIHVRTTDKIEVFDVSGAGDTVIATVAASIAAGSDYKTAGTLANMAGSIVVTKTGTAPIRSQDLIRTIDDKKSVSYFGPHDWKPALDHIQRWKARGLKVGFTNGCFDILHLGHVSYLNEARAQCDRLIVALNADSSVKILKGDGRPVHEEASRAGVLGALASVDLVVLFGAEKPGDDNTACALLEMLQPDIYFKGGDYTIDEIPEAPAVQSYGGTVEIMPVYEGHSTTQAIKKMKA